MAQIKPRGEQVDIQDTSFHISDDTTAISVIAHGLITDAGARDVMYNELVFNEIIPNINVGSVTSVFIYDTSKDDDGGAWVNEANTQSWYHESLNTAIRGATKPFPNLALIVAETETVTIYDAAKADCHMWMEFNIGGTWFSWTANTINMIADVTNDIRSIKMINGKLYVGGEGLASIDFKLDISKFNRLGESKIYGGTISDRDGNKGYEIDVTDDPILSDSINELAVTTDSNMGNIVYVATDAGVSRIAVDSTISNWTDDGQTVEVCKHITILDGYVYWTTDIGVIQKYISTQPVDFPLEDVRYNDLDYNHFMTDAPGTYNSLGRIPIYYNGLDSGINHLAHNNIATYNSLMKIYPNTDDWARSMTAIITPDFNSGIMHGDIQGAWLADTQDVNPEIIINGDFSDGTNNWIAGNGASLSVVTLQSDPVRVTNETATFGYVAQSFTTVIGKTYIVYFDYVTNGSSSVNFEARAGNLPGNNDLGAVLIGLPRQYFFKLFATATTSWVSFLVGTDNIAEYSDYDNISVREYVPSIGTNETTELVVDGTFDSACGVNWTCGADWTITGGQAIMASTSTYDPLIQAIPDVVIGQPYLLTFDVIAITNNCKVDITGGITFVFSGTGTKSVTVIPTTTTLTLNFARASLPSDMTIDNVSVKKTGNLVLNGDFSTNTDSWTAGNAATLSVVSGRLRVENTGIADPHATQTIDGLVVGERYVLTGEHWDGTGIDSHIEISMSTVYDTTDGTVTFIAELTTAVITLISASLQNGEYAEFDNISLRIADGDRSYINKGLALHGGLTRVPVNPGSELMAYSNFSIVNYFAQARNADLDFGTNDFYTMGWFRQGTLNNYKGIISKSETAVTTDYLLIDTGLDNNIRLQVGNTLRSSNTAFVLDEWHFVVVTVKDGQMKLWLDMDMQIAATVNLITSSGNAILYLGNRVDTPSAFTGELALWRIGGGAPSIDQIQTIYDQEQKMFVNDARCTLQGTSIDIITVDYDEQTNVTAVCSTDHVTKLNDLVVVDDRAEVITSISTKYDKELTGV